MLPRRYDVTLLLAVTALLGCGAELIIQRRQGANASSEQEEESGVVWSDADYGSTAGKSQAPSTSAGNEVAVDEISLLREHVSLLRQMNEALESVGDESSAAAAAKAIESLAGKMNDLARRVQEQRPPQASDFKSPLEEMADQEATQAFWQLGAERIKEVVRFQSLVPSNSTTATGRTSGAVRPQLLAAVETFVSAEQRLIKAQQDRSNATREAYLNSLRSKDSGKDVAAPASGR